jgi:periplasmic copper chaperone A
MHIRLLLAALAILLPLLSAAAHEVKLGAITLTDLWARATPPNAPTAGGYMTIANSGGEADRLMSASSPSAQAVEFHEMKVTDGVMTMRKLEGGVDIPAGASVALAPGSFHLMFVEPKKSFARGEQVPVTLTFEKAGTVETFLHVEAIGARGPAPAGHEGMEHTQ